MSGLKSPIIRVLKKIFGENSIHDNIGIERCREYFTDDKELGDIIEHFRMSIPFDKYGINITAKIYGVILQDLNNFFEEVSIPRKCVGVYFERDFLHILIKG